MDEPGGEMEASDRRLCCEIQTDKNRKKKGHGRMHTVRKLQLSFYLNIFISNSISP